MLIKEYLEELITHKKLGAAFLFSLLLFACLLIMAGRAQLAAELFSLSCVAVIILFHLFFAAPIKKRIGVARMACYGAGIIAVSSFVWYIQNYNVYYSARASVIRSESAVIYRAVANMMWRNMKPETKRDRLDKLIGNNGAEIIITEEGKDEPFFHRKGKRSDKYYIIEPFETQETLQPIKTKHATYRYQFKYGNRPFFWIGLLRAITLSILPDLFIESDTPLFSTYEKDGLLSGLVKHNNWKRSTAFYIPEIILWLSLVLVVYYTSKQAEEMNKLAVFRAAYNKIETDLSAGVTNSQNEFQYMQSSWEDQQKASTHLSRHDSINAIKDLRVLDVEEMAKLYPDETWFETYDERIDAFKRSLDTYEDKFSDQSFIADAYDFIIAPWFPIIHKELRSLDTLMTIVPVTERTDQIIQSVLTPKNVQKLSGGKIRWLSFESKISEDINPKAKCKIIPGKIERIVYNLIENASQAIQRLRANDKSYKGCITLNLYETKSGGADCLCIEINDNGGGFPQAILNDIYKKPVPTSKPDDKRKNGEATSYIGFFVAQMGGYIKAQNITNEHNQKGAQTRIYLPYVKAEESGGENDAKG